MTDILIKVGEWIFRLTILLAVVAVCVGLIGGAIVLTYHYFWWTTGVLFGVSILFLLARGEWAGRVLVSVLNQASREG